MQTLLAVGLAVAVMQHHYSFEDRETCSLCSSADDTLLQNISKLIKHLFVEQRNINRTFTTGLSHIVSFLYDSNLATQKKFALTLYKNS